MSLFKLFDFFTFYILIKKIIIKFEIYHITFGIKDTVTSINDYYCVLITVNLSI